MSKRKNASVFSGLTFCVSGTFTRSQNDLKSFLTTNGGNVASSFTKSVTHVVSSRGFSSGKVEAAKEKGFPIVTEEWVEKSIQSGRLNEDGNLFVFKPGSEGEADEKNEEEEGETN